MIEFFIDGQPVTAETGQTVIQAAHAVGILLPSFCWHPQLSVPGNCRICMVEVEDERGGDPWFDIACNMPVTKGMRVLTNSARVRELRKDTMQFITLNHPVDCGICNKSGECLLQDHHYAYNGQASLSRDAKTHATKFYPLSRRIMLDNERCIMCSRCVRFTDEISKSHALGVINRGDHALIRPSEDVNFDDDPYSDNVIDICPVGALLSRDLLDHSRVWYLKATPSVCPGCERGCSINIWHRKDSWKLLALEPRLNTSIDRVTPLDNPAVNGPWTCNKARDLALIFERPRAIQPMVNGAEVALVDAVSTAAELIANAVHAVALISSWGSNEELAAFHATLAPSFTNYVKTDWRPMPGELVEDDILIKADKNPNRFAARALFDAMPDDASTAFPAETDLVLVWGEGADVDALPKTAKVIVLNSYAQPINDSAHVFIPISIQTERNGHYTNFQGTVTPFEQCFPKFKNVADADALFASLHALAATTVSAR
ncbi:MAG: 2Fe-2S iron-sulfur cluster-binding protein [Gemmatimonadota bacterium]|nr:2Fe-2S iron-sulfur cluster-binding protein [Gemmatimonadota bacterium]